LSAATTWPDAVSRTASWTLGNYLLVSEEEVTDGKSITYAYDADQLATSATVTNLAHTMSAPRHANTGWVSSTSLKKISQALAYDPVYGQLSSVNTKFNSVDNVHTLTLQTYDGLGRLTTRKEKILTYAETTRTYTYDDAGRLSGDGTTTWAYDANGNRTTINGVTVATYDTQDRILTHQSASFTHDTNGQRITKTLSGQTTTYGYDVFGNLQTVSLPGGVVVTYELDGAGRRVGRSKSGASYRRYLLGEGNRVVAEYDQAGVIVSQFVYLTRSHVPDFMMQGSNVYRFITDQLGSVRLVVNVNASSAATSVVQRIDYDAWGNVIQDTNSGFQPFGFAGGLWDQDTKLVHFGAREYDPATGRWLQKDPISFRGGDTNLYAYAGGDPVNFVDPSGLDVWIEGPSGDEPFLHTSISIGTPGGSYESFSFALYDPGSRHSFGTVYQDVTPGGEIGRYLKTTPSQDKTAKRLIYSTWNSDSEAYYPAEVCFTYSDRKFNEIASALGSSPTTAPLAVAGARLPFTNWFAAVSYYVWAGLLAPGPRNIAY
jgi:RHS repeat-associated protein